MGNGEKSETHSELGATYFGQGKLDDAEREYIEALKIDPNDAGVHCDLGSIYYSQGKLDGAEREYKEALRIYPNDADTHCALATAYFSQGKLDNAEREYKEALKINPDHADACENLNLLHHEATSKKNPATESPSQNIAAVTSMKAQDVIQANKINAPGKSGPLETNSFVMEHINRSDRRKLVKYIIISVIFFWIAIPCIFAPGDEALAVFLVALLVALLVTAVCIFKYMKRKSSLERRPDFKVLTRFGGFYSIKAQIDAEVAHDTAVRMYGLIFTPNWIIRPDPDALFVINRSTLVWAYASHLATRHSINFVPLGTSHDYSVNLHYTEPAKRQGFVDIRMMGINTADEASSEYLLQYILQYAPWIIAGYSPEIAESWSKNASKMLDLVASKRDLAK